MSGRLCAGDGQCFVVERDARLFERRCEKLISALRVIRALDGPGVVLAMRAIAREAIIEAGGSVYTCKVMGEEPPSQ